MSAIQTCAGETAAGELEVGGAGLGQLGVAGGHGFDGVSEHAGFFFVDEHLGEAGQLEKVFGRQSKQVAGVLCACGRAQRSQVSAKGSEPQAPCC